MKSISLARTLTAFVFVVLVSGCGGGQSSASGKNDYLDAINKARAKARYCGELYYNKAKPLNWNENLRMAAYEHSYDMANSNMFDHNGSGTQTDKTAQNLKLDRGSTYKERIIDNGFTNGHQWGENIAAGSVTADEVVAEWLDSQDHCKNIMNPKFTEVGMAIYEKTGTKFRYYWTQDFGSRQ